MACGLETRVPMTDTDLVEYLAHPPQIQEFRVPHQALLRRALTGRLPRRIVNKAKVGFTIPLARWLRGPSRDFVLELTSPETLRRCDFLDAGVVGRLVDAHLDGGSNEWWRLWVLLNLIGWYRGRLLRIAPTRSHPSSPCTR